VPCPWDLLIVPSLQIEPLNLYLDSSCNFLASTSIGVKPSIIVGKFTNSRKNRIAVGQAAFLNNFLFLEFVKNQASSK
jgi:hypothetical protein